MRAGLITSVTSAGGWAVLAGWPTLCLLAAAEMGADLRRCAFSGGRRLWRDVVSATRRKYLATVLSGVQVCGALLIMWLNEYVWCP